MLTLSQIKGVGDATIKKLQELDIKSVFELFSFLPSKYIDLQEPRSIIESEAGALVLLEGRVERISALSRRGKRTFTVSFSDNLINNRKLYFSATFYNMPFLHDTFSVGDKYRLFGRLSKDEDRFNIINPQVEKIDRISKLKDIYTVYPLKGVIGQNAFKNILQNALTQIAQTRYEGRLAEVNKNLTDLFCRLHNPETINDAELARDELASVDLAIVLSMYRKLLDCNQYSRKVFYKLQNFRIEDYYCALPYTPTPSQKGAFEDILNDIKSSKNMSRIISGDVGSGKTAAAFFAMALCALSGKQCALMVPTEILARQHYIKFDELAKKFGITCALLTSSISDANRKTVLKRLQSGEIQCVIGTQSLISRDVSYKCLTLAVIDEQHKFGVNERKLLESKGAVDILSLTATPIPRSMALTFYNDINISHIKKRDEAKTNIHTCIVQSVAEGVEKIMDACKKGGQAFVVCPSIVDAEGYEILSIESFIREYGRFFDGFDVKVLHGKLSEQEKTDTMNDFAAGRIQVLIATTVVEVGIDTRASDILIIGADRFGLASLHQLRGRVGRDGSPANCYVYSSTSSDKALNRLELFCEHNDGQYLAESDFAMRGAGDFIGTRQSGSSVTPIFGLQMTSEILASAKIYADNHLKNLSIDELSALTRRSKSRVDEFLNEIGKVTLNS